MMKCKECDVNMIKLPPNDVDGIYEEVFECSFCGTIKTKRPKKGAGKKIINEDDECD